LTVLFGTNQWHSISLNQELFEERSIGITRYPMADDRVLHGLFALFVFRYSTNDLLWTVEQTGSIPLASHESLS